MTIPLILKIAGAVLMIAGLAVVAVSLLNGKRRGVFEGMEELKNIQSKGYTSEHREEVREDIYRREVISEQSRLLSRRAKRVLEKMERDESAIPEDEPKPAGVAKGTSVLEEVSGKTPTPVSASADTGRPKRQLKSRRNAQPREIAEVQPDKQKTGTAALGAASPKGTDILPGRSDGTAVLGDIPKGTDILVKTPSAASGTAVLPQAGSGTDILIKDAPPSGTDVLPPKGTGTDILMPQAESENPAGTAILQDKKTDAEGTAILSSEGRSESSAGTGTAILDR